MSEDEIVESQISQEELDAIAASAAAYEAQQAQYAADNAARWGAMLAAMNECKVEMEVREKEYQRRMARPRPRPDGAA